VGSLDQLVVCVAPYRRWASGLWWAGSLLALTTFPLASIRIGGAAGVPFAIAGIALAVLAVECARGARLALVLTAISLAGQVLGVAGSSWELITNPDNAKSKELRSLGVNPRVGVAINLMYSALAVALLMLMVVRCKRHHPRAPTR
jgi:hypothetical protein